MGAAGAEQSASVESERGGAGGELVRRCRVLCGSAAVGVLRVVLGQCGHRSAAGEYMRCGCGAVAVLVRAEVGEPRDPNTCGAVFKSLRSRVCVTAECRLTNPVFTPTHTPFLYIFSETIHMLSMSRFCFNVYRVYSDIQLPSTPFHNLPRPSKHHPRAHKKPPNCNCVTTEGGKRTRLPRSPSPAASRIRWSSGGASHSVVSVGHSFEGSFPRCRRPWAWCLEAAAAAVDAAPPAARDATETSTLKRHERMGGGKET